MSISNLVSIIAPCYNGEDKLPKFLDSVLEQTYSSIELILINDGSSDRTEEIVLNDYAKRFEDKHINLIYHYQENQGQAAAVNYGLSCFSGDYMMWVDSDDILYADNVKKKVDFLQNNLDCGFVLSKLEVVKSNNLNDPIGIQGRKQGDDSNYFRDMLTGKNVVFGPGTVMVRRSVFLNTFPDRKIFPSREGQNWQLMLPLIHGNKCGYIDDVLLKCVVYEDSHSRKKRTFEEYIQRNDGICLLLCETINTIITMDEAEKSKWIRFVKTKYANANLGLCYDNKNKELSKKYRDILKEHNAYSLKRTRLAYNIKKIINKL